MGKLTKAQMIFLRQIADVSDHATPGYDFDVLRGSEMAMARRMASAGVICERFKAGRGPFWDITPAGRQALTGEPG